MADVARCDRHNPLGKVFGKQELESLGEFCVKHNILILSDEVYEHLSYTGMTRMSSISPEISRLTLTVSSAGKSFFMTGWRVGWVIGPQQLIKHVVRAHIAICYSGVSPFQEAVADALNSTEAVPFWKQSNLEMRDRMERFTAVWDELGLPVSQHFRTEEPGSQVISITNRLPATLSSLTCLPSAFPQSTSHLRDMESSLLIARLCGFLQP